MLDSIEAVREPLLGLTPTVPVLSSGQWGGLAHATYAAVGTTDLLVLAGGGIHGHPDGSAAGVDQHARGVGVGRAGRVARRGARGLARIAPGDRDVRPGAGMTPRSPAN